MARAAASEPPPRPAPPSPSSPPGSTGFPGSTARAVAIIPARLASQRLPRKMLLAETGLPLCVHTALAAARSSALARVVLAADSEEVAAAARAHGIEVVLTPPELASGTDRVHAAYAALASRGEASLVVLNVQGDEPELDPAAFAPLVAAFADPAVELATLAAPLGSPAEAEAPQVVKVVVDARGDALYFSRSPIPARLPPAGTAASARADAPPWLAVARRHLGVYAFRPAALAEFCALPPGRLERLENLEQLRWLEAGRRIRVLETEHVSLGIDTRADYDAFVARERRRATSRR